MKSANKWGVSKKFGPIFVYIINIQNVQKNYRSLLSGAYEKKSKKQDTLHIA